MDPLGSLFLLAAPQRPVHEAPGAPHGPSTPQQEKPGPPHYLYTCGCEPAGLHTTHPQQQGSRLTGGPRSHGPV